MRTLFWSTVIGVFAACPIQAQQDSARLEVAHEILEVDGTHRVVALSESLYVQHTIAADPRWEAYKDLLSEYAAEVYDWDRLKPLIAMEFTKEFSLPELRQLLAFYQTPLGRKFVTFKPILQEQVFALLFTAQQQYRPDLKRRVLGRFEQLKKAMPKLD